MRSQLLKILRRKWRNTMWWETVISIKLIAPLMFRKNSGIYILDEEWDNLIILDACRYDIFKNEFHKENFPGKLEFRISRGTDTPSFLLENFSNREKYDDIVYLSTNPFVEKLLKGKFHKIISVWKYTHDEMSEDEKLRLIYEYSVYASIKFPDKRLIIHLPKPHSPYPNGTGVSEIIRDGNDIVGIKYRLNETLSVNVWPYVGLKSLPTEKIREGYLQNLRLILPYVKKMVNILPGTTVVSADHGEAFGEKMHPLLPIKVYGHPPKIRIEPLIKVPWLIIKPDDKTITENTKQEIIEIQKKFQRREEEKLKKVIKKIKIRTTKQ
ncbi:hypothetical protein [Thermococcus sp.]